jgi:hypothetical protein
VLDACGVSIGYAPFIVQLSDETSVWGM